MHKLLKSKHLRLPKVKNTEFEDSVLKFFHQHRLGHLLNSSHLLGDKSISFVITAKNRFVALCRSLGGKYTYTIDLTNSFKFRMEQAKKAA